MIRVERTDGGGLIIATGVVGNRTLRLAPDEAAELVSALRTLWEDPELEHVQVRGGDVRHWPAVAP